jgi:hypothetical protein
MIRKLIFGGVLACVLAAAPSALAGDVPRATLVKKADAICKTDKAKFDQIKNKPDTEKIWSWSPKQLKATAGFWADTLALARSESTQLFALGTPTEPAARKAWNRWHTLVRSYQLPQLALVAAAAKRGDLPAIYKSLTSEDSANKDDEGAKVVKSLGFKVCKF